MSRQKIPDEVPNLIRRVSELLRDGTDIHGGPAQYKGHLFKIVYEKQGQHGTPGYLKITMGDNMDKPGTMSLNLPIIAGIVRGETLLASVKKVAKYMIEGYKQLDNYIDQQRLKRLEKLQQRQQEQADSNVPE